jgi:CRP/FNR family cyclic AMP-dependent transcriptional regulator
MNEDAVSINLFFDKYPTKKYSGKETILASGEDIRSVFFIRSGIARSFYIDEKGNELTINLLKPFSFFPMSAILAGKHSVYDFQAFTSTEVKVAPVNEVLKFLEKDSSFKSLLIRNFARGLEGYLIRSFFLIKGSAMQKVASTLLMLLRRFGRELDSEQWIDLPLTHQDIADLSGITRETVSIQIGILEKEKLITRRGKKTKIMDFKALSEKAMTGEDGSLLSLSF